MALKRTPVPVSIELGDEGRLIVVTWPDARVDELKAYDLRVACPCAGCVDEMSGVRTLDPATVDAQIAAASHTLVGRYAVKFQWSDGHSTGIFTYEGLRDGTIVP